MIVVDVGCATIGTEESVNKLVDRFSPELLYGFDPQVADSMEWLRGTLVIRRSLAAWVYGGSVGWISDTTRSRVDEDANAAYVGTFVLGAWLKTLPPGAVLKLDIEGGEYRLLRQLHTFGCDSRLDRILVEWHGDPLELPFRCPVEEWH